MLFFWLTRVPASASEEVPVLLAEKQSKVADKKRPERSCAPAPSRFSPTPLAHAPPVRAHSYHDEKVMFRTHDRAPLHSRNSCNY
jgi:hypothetical protein